MNSPCQRCQRRHAACHDECPEYQAFHTAHQAEREYTRDQLQRGSLYQETWKNQAMHRNRGLVWGRRKKKGD